MLVVVVTKRMWEDGTIFPAFLLKKSLFLCNVLPTLLMTMISRLVRHSCVKSSKLYKFESEWSSLVFGELKKVSHEKKTIFVFLLGTCRYAKTHIQKAEGARCCQIDSFCEIHRSSQVCREIGDRRISINLLGWHIIIIIIIMGHTKLGV